MAKKTTASPLRTKKTPPPPPKRSLHLKMAGLVALALLLALGAIYAVKEVASEPSTDASPSPTSSSASPSAEASARPSLPTPTPTADPATGKAGALKGSDEQVKRQVLRQAEDLLNAAVVAGQSGESYGEVLVAVQEGDYSALPPAFTSVFRFSDYLATDELQSAAYIAVIHLSTLITTVAEDNAGTVQPLTASAWQNVYVDRQARQAFVPMTIFLGEQASFSLEFVYVGGEWKFSPYALIDAIQAAERASSTA